MAKPSPPVLVLPAGPDQAIEILTKLFPIRLAEVFINDLTVNVIFNFCFNRIKYLVENQFFNFYLKFETIKFKIYMFLFN